MILFGACSISVGISMGVLYGSYDDALPEKVWDIIEATLPTTTSTDKPTSTDVPGSTESSTTATSTDSTITQTSATTGMIFIS